MKKTVTLVVLLFLGLTVSYAQKDKKASKAAPAEINVSGPGMIFESEVVDYGDVEFNADGNRVFHFTNNGNKPLIITNAVGSCGCTVPTFPKEPIMPGAKGTIGVKYDTSRVGAFTKTITLTTNLETQNKTLTVKGNVKPKVQ